MPAASVTHESWLKVAGPVDAVSLVALNDTVAPASGDPFFVTLAVITVVDPMVAFAAPDTERCQTAGLEDGDADGVGLGDGDALGAGVGVGSGEALGVGEGVADGEGVGEAEGDGSGVADGDESGGVDGGGGGGALGLGEGGGVVPSSAIAADVGIHRLAIFDPVPERDSTAAS